MKTLTKQKDAQTWLWIIFVVLVIAIIIVIVYYASNPSMNSNNQTNGIYGTTQNTIKVASSNLGNILTDNNGRTLYVFMADSSNSSNCYGGCAGVWPPLLISGNVKPTGQGVTGILGSFQRTDGTYQITINAMPLYFYSGDSSSGTTNGQGINGFGGLWYVVSSSGQIITSSSSSSASSSTSSSSSSSGSSSGY